jgi:hypothetical protein
LRQSNFAFAPVPLLATLEVLGGHPPPKRWNVHLNRPKTDTPWKGQSSLTASSPLLRDHAATDPHRSL